GLFEPSNCKGEYPGAGHHGDHGRFHDLSRHGACGGSGSASRAARARSAGLFRHPRHHDYGLRWSRAHVADQLVRRLPYIGIGLLRNEVRDVAGLQLVGLDDLWGPNFHPESVLSKVNWDGPALTLCHNPDAVDLPALANVRGWVLSGHTHGGQCKPPFLPPPIVPVKNKRYTAGAFAVGPGRQLYINRGLGYLRRVRFNARPEITVFCLQRA